MGASHVCTKLFSCYCSINCSLNVSAFFVLCVSEPLGVRVFMSEKSVIAQAIIYSLHCRREYGEERSVYEYRFGIFIHYSNSNAGEIKYLFT